MENSAIIVKALLQGNVSGFISHVDVQKMSVQVANNEGKRSFVSGDILHSDRVPSQSYIRTFIPSEIVGLWLKGESPYWERPRDWSKKTQKQRLESYLSRFDEGFGVTHELID